LPIMRPVWLGLGAVISKPASQATQPADAERERAKLPENEVKNFSRSLLLVENAWTIGSDVLVRPVMERGARKVRVPFPAHGCVDLDVEHKAIVARIEAPCVWYSVLTGDLIHGGRWRIFNVDISSMPSWQRGGSILPRRQRVRRSSLLTVWDPLTLHVAPDISGRARGMVYVDDGVSPHSALEGGAASSHTSPKALLAINFACHAGSQITARRCRLTSTPEQRLRNGPAVPSSAYIERVLFRGTHLCSTGPKPASTVRDLSARHKHIVETVLLRIGRGVPEPTIGTVTASHEGLLLEQVRLPLEDTWEIDLLSVSLEVLDSEQCND